MKGYPVRRPSTAPRPPAGSRRQPGDERLMREALRLARFGYGSTSPNPMVGAVLVRKGKIIGRGWHRRAGAPHAEIEAIKDARLRGVSPRGATLYVTLEPCSTYGRTPPCTDAIIRERIARVVIGATDPNPNHRGRGIRLLEQAGIEVSRGVLEQPCTDLNEAFNYWIVRRVPWVTVKAAMTLDGKIATAAGESKWITGPQARAIGMHLRQGVDAIIAGINTVLLDDPSLSFRPASPAAADAAQDEIPLPHKRLRRIILDAGARTPTDAKVFEDQHLSPTTIVVSAGAPPKRVKALRAVAEVVECPANTVVPVCLDLPWVLSWLGAQNVTHVLVEGGGEVNASFLLGRLAHRVAFFYAPKILGGRLARKGVAGNGAEKPEQMLHLEDPQWRRAGKDWFLWARIAPPAR